MNQTAIEARHLTKIYKLYDSPFERLKESINPFAGKRHRNYYALDDVSFTVAKGETVGIIGKNGSGKSTLLKIIAGVLTPTAGTIAVEGKVAALLELGAGFNPELTGVENIYLSGLIMGYSREQMDARLANIVAFADIGEYIRQPVKMYSSGMFARLAFAVNTNVGPDIFIVDEALAVGDIFFQAKCARQMKKMVDNGTILLFVSHDLDAVKSLCRTALWLKEGKMHFHGDAKSVTMEYSKKIIEEINYWSADMPADCANATVEKTLVVEAWAAETDEFGDDPGHFRAGNGALRFMKVEVLDNEGLPLLHTAEFNKEIAIKCFVRIIKDCTNFAIGYHIRNKQGQEILGNDTYTAGTDIYARKWKKGDQLIVSFKTRLPLLHGVYSLNLLASGFSDPACPTDVVFLDWVENAYVFEMKVRRPAPLFDLIYLKGAVSYEAF